MSKLTRSDEAKVSQFQIKSKAHPSTGSGRWFKDAIDKNHGELVEPLILVFGIHLTFACLPQVGILKFGIALKY
jgi:hypothetical protein